MVLFSLSSPLLPLPSFLFTATQQMESDEATHLTEISSSSDPCAMRDEIPEEDSYPSHFQCCVCLDLLYKPVVLACGHMSCFWCVHRAMHGLQTSHCAMCRQPFIHFPGICQVLHHLLLKMQPVAYRRRESEVLEEERRLDVFSPQFGDSMSPVTGTSKENGSSEDSIDSNNMASEEPRIPKDDLQSGTHNQVSVDDLSCALCKELLFQPAVLNCGHAFCESCLSEQENGLLACPDCGSLHPGDFPNVCLDLDHFLEEQFPREYMTRKGQAQLKRAKCQQGQSSSSSTSKLKKNAKAPFSEDDHLCLVEDLHNVHVGVGCDSCGMYPIIGKRYKCKDCKEAIGFDLCEKCYNTSSKLPGRFNQQHTPDHKFDLDDSQLLCNILLRSLPPGDGQQGSHPVIIPDDPENRDDLDDNNEFC